MGSKPVSACLRARFCVGLLLVAVAWVVIAQQQDQEVLMHTPVPERAGPLRKAQVLLREGKTEEARKELEAQRKARPNDAEVLYQIARSYLLDFYQLPDDGKRRVALGLAMEALNAVLKANPDH